MKPVGTPASTPNEAIIDEFVAYKKATKGLTPRGEEWLRDMTGRFLNQSGMSVTDVGPQQIVAQIGELVEICASKAFEAIQRESQAKGKVKAKESGIIGWFTSAFTGQTTNVMRQFESESHRQLQELHSKALGTDNPTVVAQANTPANLVQVAIYSADIVGRFYDAPLAA